MLNSIKFGGRDFLKITPVDESKDAFGRLRTSQPNSVFDSKHIYDKLPLVWDESIVGGQSIHSSGNACVDMTVNSSGQSIIRQTKYRFNYNPGKSQQYLFTGVLGSGISNLTRRIGCYDENDGLFFELDNSQLNTVIRKSGIDTRTSQNNWNTFKLDGTDNTDIILDTSKSQIFIIDYQWLGVGSVRFGFDINGNIYYCHQQHHANLSDNVYMSTPNLPIRYEIISNGGSGVLKQICSTCISEGGNNRWLTRSESTNNAVNANTIDVNYILLGLRLKSSNLSANINIDSLNLLSITNDNFKWTLSLNPIYSGTLIYSDIQNSYLQIGRTSGGNPSTEVITSGNIKIAEGYGSTQIRIAEHSLDNLYNLGSKIDKTRDELILSVTPYSANADIYASIGWKEYL